MTCCHGENVCGLCLGDAILKAIASERERCAKIADMYLSASQDYWDGVNHAVQEIAAKIREGK